MAVPDLGVAYQVDGLSFENDGNGGLCVKVYQNDYDSEGTGEPNMIREINLTTTERGLLITAISDS